MKNKQPEKYLYIRVWGEFLGSFPYYIQDQKERAEAENAPDDALFKQADGSWVTLADCEDGLREMLEFRAQEKV